MSKILDKPNVSVLFWQSSDGFGSLIADQIATLGFNVENFLFDAPLPENTDLVFAYAPFNSLYPVAKRLSSLKGLQKPNLVLWMTEPLPNPAQGEWMWRVFGEFRSLMERWSYDLSSKPLRTLLNWVNRKAYRYRYYGDLHWLQRQGLLLTLAVTSSWNCNLLTEKGFNPVVAYVGSHIHRQWGMDLGLKRDIPVLWIGKVATARRKQILKRLRLELSQRGVEMMVVDGVEHPYVFGEERTILFNRAKVTLNVLRHPWDDNSMRYFLAAPNRTLIITELTLPHTPFIPNVHLVQSSIAEMADTVCYYLEHEDERREIVDQAYELASTKLTLENSLRTILEHAVTSYNTINRQTAQHGL